MNAQAKKFKQFDEAILAMSGIDFDRLASHCLTIYRYAEFICRT